MSSNNMNTVSNKSEGIKHESTIKSILENPQTWIVSQL